MFEIDIIGINVQIDNIVKHLSMIFKTKYPMVEGLFDTVELLNAQLPHKIDGQGLCVIHCKPINHYILAENMDNDRNIKVWDGQRHPTDNVNTRTQMAKVFVTDNEDTLEYTYVKNAVQQNGFECGDLCFAKGIALLNGNDASTVEFSSADKIRCHTCTILITQNMAPYPKSTFKKYRYTQPKSIKLSLLKCCRLPITYAAIVTCICGHQEHGICLGLNNDENSNEYRCAKCVRN